MATFSKEAWEEIIKEATPQPEGEIDPERVSPHTKVIDQSCACFPGMCRGGQVVDGKLQNGDRCKLSIGADADGWISLGGSPRHMPVSGDTEVEVKLRSGVIGCDKAESFNWRHLELDSSDIIAWRLPKDAKLTPLETLRPDIAASHAGMDETLNVGGDPISKARFDAVYGKPSHVDTTNPASELYPHRIDATESLRRYTAAVKTLEQLGYSHRGGEQWAPPIGKAPAFTAPDLLDAAAGHMRDRAKTYDKPEGERSMAATVEAFNAITGRDLTEHEGWLLMVCLKLVRSETKRDPHRDSVEDLVAYSGLYGEARLGGA